VCRMQRQDDIVSGSLAVEDPMLLEAALFSAGPSDPPSSPLAAPVLDAVVFDSPTPLSAGSAMVQQVEQALLAPVQPVPSQPPLVTSDTASLQAPQNGAFVNTSRGSAPDGLQEGVLPTSPSFSRVLAKPIAASVVPTPPPLRRTRKMVMVQVPRRRSRLAKKALRRTPAVAAAQNVLMRKLGLAGEGHLDCGAVLVWNVRSLNRKSHRDAVRESVAAERPSVVCLQETKMHVIFQSNVMQFLGTGFDYFFLLADGTRGDVLLAWRTDIWSTSSTSARYFSVLASLTPVAGAINGGSLRSTVRYRWSSSRVSWSSYTI
jgi:hypothetical protein